MARVLPSWNTAAGDPLTGTATASGLSEHHQGPSEGAVQGPKATWLQAQPSPLPQPALRSRSISTLCIWHLSFPRWGGA